MTATTAADWIKELGGIVGALTIIVGSVAALLRFSTRRFVASVREVVADHLDEIKINTEQLKPNGGSSIADAVRRVEARQLEIGAETRAVRSALEEHLAEHRRIS